ncbi:MAG TPA: hypothetical protein PLX14_08640 [Anaerolineales bacterium]|nr:hypothetical protein [Anaerolineales bacterium]
MSKLPFRVFLSVLISAALIFGIYMSVRAASFFAPQARHSVGAYVLSGSLVKPFQAQTTEASSQSAGEVQQFNMAPGPGGHTCESESQINPEE